MKVVVLSGSVGKQSCTRTVLKYVEKELKGQGVEVSFWDLAKNPLPIAVPEYYTAPEKNPLKVVGRFVRKVKASDGVVLGSPLYHGSYSGVLKNALDNLPPDAFWGKPVGLLSHSSNARSCLRPCYDLRSIVSSLGGYSLRKQIGTTTGDFAINDQKITLKSSQIQQRAQDLIEELIDLSKHLQQPLKA